MHWDTRVDKGVGCSRNLTQRTVESREGIWIVLLRAGFAIYIVDKATCCIACATYARLKLPIPSSRQHLEHVTWKTVWRYGDISKVGFNLIHSQIWIR